jgi:hypothetical protein
MRECRAVLGNANVILPGPLSIFLLGQENRRDFGMTTLIIKQHQGASTDCCSLCGGRITLAGRLHLTVSDGPEVVCRQCGHKHAPSLVALLDLAQVAERVGRIGRHTLVPPLGALLDLARAAEDYTQTTPERRKKAA